MALGMGGARSGEEVGERLRGAGLSEFAASFSIALMHTHQQLGTTW